MFGKEDAKGFHSLNISALSVCSALGGMPDAVRISHCARCLQDKVAGFFTERLLNRLISLELQV